MLAAFLRSGKVVLLPFGDSQRYDIVVDEGGIFTRVQVKTACLKANHLVFECRSSNWNTGLRKSYNGQADLFAVYSPDLDKIYLIPVSHVGANNRANLRLTSLVHKGRYADRPATQYEFDPNKTSCLHALWANLPAGT